MGALSAEITRGKTGDQTQGAQSSAPEFYRNVFVKTTKQGTIPERDLGRGRSERWRKRKENEEKPIPERISFNEKDTKPQMARFLHDIATDIKLDGLDKPGGMDNLLPFEQALVEALDLNKGSLDSTILTQNINAMLNTAEGWIVAKGALDQDLAIRSFAAGITHYGGQAAESQERFSDVLRRYSKDEGGLHKFDRSVGQGFVKHWGVYTALGLAPLTLGASLVVGAVAKVIESSTRRGRRFNEAEVEARACSDALELIQNNDRLRNYAKRAGMDAKDYIVENGRVIRNPAVRSEDRGSKVTMEGYMEGLMEHTHLRQLYYRDLHVPLSQQYAQAEQFLFARNNGELGLFELTGDRLHADTVDIWQNLRRAQTEARRRNGPEIEADENTQRANLLRDRSGRGVDSPMHGRDYPTGVEPPPFDPDHLLEEHLDQWRQAPQRTDGTHWSANITFPATLNIENNLYPPDSNPLERQRSDWYGRAPAERVFFLGTEAVPYQSGSPETNYRLNRLAEAHPTNPDGTIHRRDTSGSKLYEYEYTGTRRVVISETTAQQQIFYITPDGERIPLSDSRIIKTNNLTQAEYQFTPRFGAPRIIDTQDMFYIPRNGTDAPIPFGYLRDVPTANYTPGDPIGFVFDPNAGPFPPVEVAENKFYLVNPGAIPDSMANRPENPAFLEDFYRDTWFIPPGNELTPYDRNAQEQAFLYGRDFPSIRLATMDRLVRSGALEAGVTIDELQQYVQGALLPPERQAIISRIDQAREPRARGIRARILRSMGHRTPEQIAFDEQRRTRPLQPLDEANFRSRDNAGRSPRDIRFGITNPDILAALDTLPPADITGQLPYLQATGRDQWGQLPSDPFFCRADRQNFQYFALGIVQTVNLNEAIDLNSIDVDAWGQRRSYENGETNPFFMIQDENQVGAREEGLQNDRELWLRARELALGNVTETLIRKMRKIPLRNRSVIQAKIKARRENGPNLQKRIEQAGKDKPVFAAAETILDKRLKNIQAYKEAQDKLTKARTELPQYLTETFGPSFPATAPDAANVAIAQIREALSGASTTSLDVKFEGRDVSIEPIREQKRKAAEVRSTAYKDIMSTNPREYEDITDPVTHVTTRRWIETDAEWKARLKPDFQLAEDDYNAAKAVWEADARILSGIQTEIEKQQKIIKDQEKALAADGQTTKDRDAALRPEGQARAEFATLLADSRISPDQWQAMSITELLTIINSEHANDENFGWPAYENTTQENQELLLYAMFYGRIRAYADAAGTTPVERAWGAATSAGGATPQSIENALAVAIAAVPEDYKEQLLKQLFRQTERQTRRINNLEQAAKDDPDLLEEVGILEATDAAMARQGIIFASTAGFMARVSQTVPLDGDNPQLISSSQEYRDAIQETGIPDTTPIAILELYDAMFGWRGRADQQDFLKKIYEALPPDELIEVLLRRAPETIPPLRNTTNDFIVDLHRTIGDPEIGLQISRKDLRIMFVGVLDHLEEKSLSFYDPTEVYGDQAEAARIRALNLGLPVPSLN